VRSNNSLRKIPHRNVKRGVLQAGKKGRKSSADETSSRKGAEIGVGGGSKQGVDNVGKEKLATPKFLGEGE